MSKKNKPRLKVTYVQNPGGLSVDDLFDDCPICQAEKLALSRGRNATMEELQVAFKKAKERGHPTFGV